MPEKLKCKRPTNVRPESTGGTLLRVSPATDDNVTDATITFKWKKPQTLRYVMLQEYIRKGQRVKAFCIETSNDGVNWEKQAANIAQTTIGYKRIIPMNGSTADSYGQGVRAAWLRVRILDSRACPLLSNISIY